MSVNDPDRRHYPRHRATRQGRSRSDGREGRKNRAEVRNFSRLGRHDYGRDRVEAQVDGCLMTWGYSSDLRKRAFIRLIPADLTQRSANEFRFGLLAGRVTVSIPTASIVSRNDSQNLRRACGAIPGSSRVSRYSLPLRVLASRAVSDLRQGSPLTVGQT